MKELCKNCLGCINPSANIKAGQCSARIIYTEEQKKYEQERIKPFWSSKQIMKKRSLTEDYIVVDVDQANKV
jgi:hypothetical protein